MFEENTNTTGPVGSFEAPANDPSENGKVFILPLIAEPKKVSTAKVVGIGVGTATAVIGTAILIDAATTTVVFPWSGKLTTQARRDQEDAVRSVITEGKSERKAARLAKKAERHERKGKDAKLVKDVEKLVKVTERLDIAATRLTEYRNTTHGSINKSVDQVNEIKSRYDLKKPATVVEGEVVEVNDEAPKSNDKTPKGQVNGGTDEAPKAA